MKSSSTRSLPKLSGRSAWAGALSAAWTLLFLPLWLRWFEVAGSADLHSHILLIPVVSLYLLFSDRKELAPPGTGSRWGIGMVLLALVAIGVFVGVRPAWSEVDSVAFLVLGYLVGLWGVLLAVLGGAWFRSALFPMGFLLFMAPLPGWLEHGLEGWLMVASAWLAEWVFDVGGIPVFRDGQVLELPGMTLEVAQECSGIRSTVVLFITSLLAAYMFLRGWPRRLGLVAAVIPLGILRNAVRIYVIGWLCVNHGAEMINHWLHRKGGPLFFAISLVPLFLLAWLLRRTQASPRKDTE